MNTNAERIEQLASEIEKRMSIYDGHRYIQNEKDQPELKKEILELKWNKFDVEITEEMLSLVHVTNFFPKNNEIRSRASARVVDSNYKNDKKVTYVSHRNTVHFSMNGKVGNHSLGNWNETQIGIVDVMPSVSNIVNYRTEDTYTWGNYTLSDKAVILVSENKYETLTAEEKKNAKIVIYDNDLTEAIDKINILNRIKPQAVSAHAWDCLDYYQNSDDLAVINYYKARGKRIDPHFVSVYNNFEDTLDNRDMNLSAYRNETVNTLEGGPITLEEIENLFSKYKEKDNEPDAFIQKAYFFAKNGIVFDESNEQFRLVSDNETFSFYLKYLDPLLQKESQIPLVLKEKKPVLIAFEQMKQKKLQMQEKEAMEQLLNRPFSSYSDSSIEDQRKIIKFLSKNNHAGSSYGWEVGIDSENNARGKFIFDEEEDNPIIAEYEEKKEVPTDYSVTKKINEEGDTMKDVIEKARVFTETFISKTDQYLEVEKERNNQASKK